MNIKDPRIGVIFSIITITLILLVVGSVAYFIQGVPQELLDKKMDITFSEFFELIFWIMILVIILSIMLITSTDDIAEYIKPKVNQWWMKRKK